MSKLLFVRVDTSKFYPEFYERLKALLDDAQRNHDASYWVISGFRSYGEQDALYAQGRTKPGRIVTNAQKGESAHCFGVAADLCLDELVERSGLQPDWRPKSYEVLRVLAPKHRLLWGGDWKVPDFPHVQMPGCVTASQLAPLRRRYEASGLLSVFEHLKEQPS